jgi:hypothetical protein
LYVISFAFNPFTSFGQTIIMMACKGNFYTKILKL